MYLWNQPEALDPVIDGLGRMKEIGVGALAIAVGLIIAAAVLYGLRSDRQHVLELIWKNEERRDRQAKKRKRDGIEGDP